MARRNGMVECRDCGTWIHETNLCRHRAEVCQGRGTIAGNKRSLSPSSSVLEAKQPFPCDPDKPLSHPPTKARATKVVCSDCGCQVRESNLTKHLEFSCTKRVLRTRILEVETTTAEAMGVPTSKPLSNPQSPVAVDGGVVVDLCCDDNESQSQPEEEEILDPELRRVYGEVDISSRSIRQLQKHHGIQTLKDLLEKMDELEAHSLLHVKKQTQKRLYTFCLWYQDFYAEHANHVPWQGRFDEDDNLLDDFEQEVRQTDSMSELAIPILLEHAIYMLHEDTSNRSGNLHALPNHHCELLYEYAAKKVYDNMSPDLREKCHFPIETFAFKIIKAILNLPSGKPLGKTFLVYGRTQAGKSAFNALMVLLSETLQCLLLNTTKGVSESDDLRDKMKGYLSQSKKRDHAFRHFGIKEGEAWVIADTYAQIERAVEDIQARRARKASGKFWVVIDESDSVYRTAERDQRMEKAMDSLMQLGPCVKVLLSATSVPSILGCLEEGGAEREVEILKVGTADDYFGIDEMRPLKDKEGNCLFLNRDEVSRKEGVDYVHFRTVDLDTQNCNQKELFCGDYKADIETKRFPSCDSLSFIPYTSGKVIRMFDVALAYSGSKGTLILDCTATFVNVGLTIFHKAACLQNYYHQQGKPMIVVVFVGQEIHFRIRGFSRGRFVSSKTKTIQQVLQKLDDEYGLSTPIAVFGYIKMRRCISFRSDHRVPTHMILKLGKGHSNENFVQALGRGTGNFKSVLKENGHECVTLLTDQNDFLMATKYENFCPEVQDRRHGGANLREAIMGADQKFPDSANFLRHTNRKVGQRKDFRAMCPGRGAFEEPIGDFAQKENWTSIIIQGVLRAMRDLLQEDSKASFTVREIENKFNGTYQQGDLGITKHELKTVIRSLCANNALHQDCSHVGTLKHYAVKNGTDFGSLINPELNHCFTSTYDES